MVRRLVVILTLLFAISAQAGDGGYRSPFAVGFGARQLGMGGATVANINTSSSIFWNPAGLANVDRAEIQLFHMTLFMDTRYDFVALAYPTVSMGAFGFGVGDLGSGDFDRIEDYVTVGTFSSRQDLFLAGYGFPLFKGLSTGVTVKGVYYDIAGYRDSGFGFDLGLIYKFGFARGLSFGLKGSDIGGPSIKLNTLEQRYPWSVRGGLAYENLLGGKHSLRLNFDMENTEKLGMDIYAGGEFGLNNMLFLRAGYMGDKPTFGGGLTYAGITFDYAFASMTDLESSHRISLSYSFGGSVHQKRETQRQRIGEEQLNRYKSQQEDERLEKLDRELARAEQLESENKPYEAIEAYYKALALDTQNPQALNKITLMFNQIRQDLARDANKGYAEQLLESQLEMGDNYYSQKQYESAANQYNLALIISPDNKHAKDRLAAIEQTKQTEIAGIRERIQTQIDRGDYESALISVSRILALNPNDNQAIASRDRIVKVVESSQYLSEALKYFDQAEYSRSKAMADSALVLNPQSEGAQSLRRQLAKYTAEVTTLEDIKKNEEHWNIYLKGMEKYQAGEYKEAITQWQSLQEFYPNNPNLKRNIEQAAERSANQ